MATVRIENVSKKYDEVIAVENLNLDIEDSEFVAILGPSGCGKTSTIRMVAGLEEITDGLISIGDRTVNNLTPQERNVAMAFESYALYPPLTIFENVAFPLRSKGVPDAEVKKAVTRISEMLDISEILKEYPKSLSGGQKQRIGLARALVRSPDVLLLDEPISHLDSRHRCRMRAQLKKLIHDVNITTLYITHDQQEGIALSDRMAVMNFGELQQFDTPDNIFNNPKNKFVADFVGEPPMNFIEVELISEGGNKYFINDAVKIKVPEQFNKLDLPNQLELGIRPFHCEASLKDPHTENTIKGKIFIIEMLGESNLLTVKLGDNLMQVEINSEFDAKLDEPVWISLNLSKLHLFDIENGFSLKERGE